MFGEGRKTANGSPTGTPARHGGGEGGIFFKQHGVKGFKERRQQRHREIKMSMLRGATPRWWCRPGHGEGGTGGETTKKNAPVISALRGNNHVSAAVLKIR